MKQPEDLFTIEIDLPNVTDQVAMTRAQSQLVLSTFPGIDLFGQGFEQEGFCVVRAPDKILGGDIRRFHAIPGRFDGVIGGPPCPDFSRARRCEPTGYGLEMLAEYKRVVTEAKPTWFLMENVAGVPDMKIDGYSHQRIDINASECGLKQNRLRHFQFGHRNGHVITVDRMPNVKDAEPCCLASEGQQANRRGWPEFCELQGLPRDLRLDEFTLSARYRAVGNGVPIPMARAMARAILNARPLAGFALCECGCGRPVTGKARSAGAACRKRLERRRNVTAPAPAAVEESQATL